MKRRKRLLMGAVAVLTAVVAVSAALGRERPVVVKAETVEQRGIVRVVLANGYLAPLEEEVLSARYPMVIERVLVEEGDQVEKGQVLVLGDRRELEVEQQVLAAELSSARARLAELEATLPLKVAQAETQVASARNEFEQARKEADTAARLFEVGVLPEVELSRAQGRLAAAEAQLKVAEAALAEARIRAETVEEQRKQVDALAVRLGLVQQKLKACTATAPRAGRVAEVPVRAGTAVGAGSALVVLHAGGLKVEAEVLARDAPEVALGQKALVSLQDAEGRKLAGTVVRIHPQAVERVSELGVRQRRVPIEIALSETPERAGPGYPVEVEIVTAEVQAVAVPRDAVFQLEGKDYVFRVQDGRAVLTPVTLGLEGDDYLECVSGLQVGDVVIVSPGAEVTDGSRVAAKKAPGDRPSAGK